MKGLYLFALLFSLGGLTFIDYRFKLAFFYQRQRTLKILAVSMAVFIIWDIAGIWADIFFIGSNEVLSGIRIGEFPIEELFFLLLLNYNSLLIYLFLKRKAGQR